MKTFKQFIDEAGDYWHPDPEKDRRISGVGNKERAREDVPKAKPKVKTVKVDSNELKPGESYMDFSKRKSQSTSSPTKKPSLSDRIKIKLGKVIDRVGGIG